METKLPKGWEWKKLGEIAEKIHYGYTASAVEKEIGPKLLRITDIQDNNVNWESVPFCEIDDKEKEKYLLQEGDLVFARTGATVGKSYLLEGDVPESVFASYLIRVILSNTVSKKYVYYFFQSSSYWLQIQSGKVGAGQPNVNATKLSEITLPIPRLETQQKIVSILEKAEETKKLRAQADELTQQLLQSVFLEMFGDLVENPNEWDMKKIGDIAEIKTGGTPSRNNEEYWQNGTLPWVKTTEIKENVIYETEELITESGFQNSNATLIPQNSILIAMYGQGKTRGKTAKLGIQSTTNQACAAILPSNKYESDFLWTFLRLSYDTLRSLGRGGNQPNLNLSMIKDFKIYLPPIENQKKFSEICNLIEKSKLSQNQSSVKINNLFDALMQKAFTGELVS